MRYIKCYRAIALKLLIIFKDVSNKSFSVWEGRHTGPPYFFIGGGAEATSSSTPLFKMKPCIFFSMTVLPILRRIQRSTTQGHSGHVKYENSRKIIFISFHSLQYSWYYTSIGYRWYRQKVSIFWSREQAITNNNKNTIRPKNPLNQRTPHWTETKDHHSRTMHEQTRPALQNYLVNKTYSNVHDELSSRGGALKMYAKRNVWTRLDVETSWIIVEEFGDSS